ncbi:phage tail protein [Mammaliicoccus vitulinus]|uniref:prophage endopeptidase tail family protein n=1 Tax=Mammaliicoccus vitulinus TaxID=71237 RepID=UPI0019505ACC|nr:prophage endopeptidase tail family protein [Mammaliicoccus vitulinus]MBM6630344.1 phage tail protein [Mammaliicoccus vitulinus]
MDNLVLQNSDRTFSENLIDYDIDSWKRTDEKNGERSIALTAFKTNVNSDVFQYIQNDSILLWEGQEYIIKTTDIKTDNTTITNDIIAHHIMYEFQGHYVEKPFKDSEDDTENTVKKYTLKEYLDYIFSGNKQGFKYVIVGKFNKSIRVDEIGDKNGIEHLKDGAELFGYLFRADNKTIYIYDEESYYTMSDVEILGDYNNDDISLSVDNQEQKTYIKGYGKKLSTKSYKKYMPLKPVDLRYTGTFIKKGTWYTEQVNAYYYSTIICKWGNENISWSLKKGSLGGIVKVFVDGAEYGTYNQYSKTATTETIEVAKRVRKGNHTIKVQFIGASPKVNYGGKKPVMYVGTEKSIMFNVSAELQGEDLYTVKAEYYSPNYDKNNPKIAPTIFDDKVIEQSDLEERLKKELNDEPVLELATNYLDTEQITARDKVYFKQKSLGIDTVLKVIKITESHPILGLPVEVDFSNERIDIISIQNKINKQMFNNAKKIGTNLGTGSSFVMPRIASDSFGSVLVSE